MFILNKNVSKYPKTNSKISRTRKVPIFNRVLLVCTNPWNNIMSDQWDCVEIVCVTTLFRIAKLVLFEKKHTLDWSFWKNMRWRFPSKFSCQICWSMNFSLLVRSEYKSGSLHPSWNVAKRKSGLIQTKPTKFPMLTLVSEFDENIRSSPSTIIDL